MEIKRYHIERCDCDGCLKRYEENAGGDWVLWSDVEPLLLPLTDEQVLQLSSEIFDADKQWVSDVHNIPDAGDVRRNTAHGHLKRQFCDAVRAALKEVGR